MLDVCALAAATLLFQPPQHVVPDLYVAANGSDNWSGRISKPNRARTDGPFATIARAQKAVRERIANGLRAASFVSIDVGTYFLDKPLVFGPEDSGKTDMHVIYASAGAVISGGVLIKGWKVDGKGWWHVSIPDVASGKWMFSQLFVNGQRRYRPRLPKQGYYFIDDALPPTQKSAGKGFDRFRFKAGEIKADWHNLSDVEVLGFQTWTMARLRIESVDEKERVVTFTGPTRGLDNWASLPKGNRYLVENVREAMGQPGEFYLDRSSGELTYIPLPGENPATTRVIAPKLQQLVRLEGNVAGRKWVENLRFQGLTFAHTNWNSPPEGNCFSQAEVNLGAAISAVGARDCVFDDCHVERCGEYAIELGPGCKRNTLHSCTLTDLAGGGVKIGAGGISPDEETIASRNMVTNCVIAHCGRMHPAAVGVWIGQSHDNQIIDNEIADLYYTGISVGWTWGYGPSLAGHNSLERNHIHHIGQGVLSDMGGIYTLGMSPGTVERGNRIHDVVSFDYGGWGIYPDEGSTGILIEKNIVYRCKSAGFHQHYGKENIVRQNIFAFNKESQIMRSRAEDHLSFTFDRNIIVWDSGELLKSTWEGNNYKFDNNLYWHFGKPFTFAGMSLEQWRAKGQDAHSVITDPMFINPAKGDFRIRGLPGAEWGFSSGGTTRRSVEVTLPHAFPIAQ